MSEDHPVFIEHNGETFVREKDATENRELREFIEGRRDYVGAIPEPDELCERNKGYVEAVKTLCDELEDLIDE